MSDTPSDHRAPTTDAVLIALSLQEPPAFAGIFDRHWARIHRFCTSRAGPNGEELAAETFRVAFDERGRYDPCYPDAAPWLYGIATNLVRQAFRRAERGQRAAARADRPDEPDFAEATLGRLEAQRLGPELSLALGSIPEVDRDALLLLAWGGLTYEEIARATQSPIGTVRSRIHRARARLRAELPHLREEVR